MNITAFLLLSMALTVSQSQQTQPAPQWTVETKIVNGPETMLASRKLTASIRSGTGKSFKIESSTYMDRVVHQWEHGNTLMLLGRSDWQDEVLFIDTNKETVIGRAIGYEMRIFDNRWLVSTEFFPNRLSPDAYSSDVLLVKDLFEPNTSCSAKTASEDQTLPLEFVPLVVTAGIPVYPEANAERCSYQNVSNNPSITTIDHSSLSSLPGGRMVFVAYSGNSTAAGSEGSLVVIRFGEARASSVVRRISLAKVYQAAAISDKKRLQIDHLEPDGESGVKIVFSSGTYPFPYVVIPIRP